MIFRITDVDPTADTEQRGDEEAGLIIRKGGEWGGYAGIEEAEAEDCDEWERKVKAGSRQ